MASVFPVFKPRGITPLQCVKKFKELYPLFASSIVSYAGRLDPMADGLLLLLIGNENKKRDIYQHTDKVYEFTVLFGIETDTYDLLGEVTHFQPDTLKYQNKISSSFMKLFVKKFSQPYPPYSSKPVKGKPLFYWAREGRLNEVVIPKKEVEITSLRIKRMGICSLEGIIFDIRQLFPTLAGDFRQQEILQIWENLYKQNPSAVFLTTTFTISCTSGTYIRSLAHEMGQKLRCKAIALRIRKTHQGTFSLHTAQPLFTLI